MKILLIGEYYSNNLGDPLLCQVVINTIRDSFPKAEIIPFDMSGRTGFNSIFEPTQYSQKQKIYYQLRSRVPFILECYSLGRVIGLDINRYMRTTCMLDSVLQENMFDLAVFAGGSIFMDYFAGVIHGIVNRLSKHNIPILFHACGMSHLTKDTESVLKKAMSSSSIKHISLRDSYSYFSQKLYTNCDISETFDTALVCSEYFKMETAIIADIGIGVIAVPEYLAFQERLIRSIQEKKCSWRLFTNGSPEDWRMANKILDRLNIPISQRKNYIMKNPQNISELISNVCSFRRIVSFRMHSLIIAFSYGIPSYGFVWDNKVKELYEKMGFAHNCIYPINSINVDEMMSKLNINKEDLKNAALNAGKSSQRSLIRQIMRINTCSN